MRPQQISPKISPGLAPQTYSNHQKPKKIQNGQLRKLATLACQLTLINTVVTGAIGTLARSQLQVIFPDLQLLLTKALLETIKKSAFCAITSTFFASIMTKEGRISRMIQVINEKTQLGSKPFIFIYLYTLSVITTTSISALSIIAHNYFFSKTLKIVPLSTLTSTFISHVSLSLLPSFLLT